MKEQMKQIMLLAWLLVREANLTISDGLRMSWKNYKLKKEMRNKVVSFRYKKINGELREAQGTLSERIIPSRSSESNRKPCDTVQCYYDCGKEAWRSFRKANLIGLIDAIC